MEKYEDITSKIQVDTELEEKTGVKVKSIFAKFSYYMDEVPEITITGEIKPKDGNKIHQKMQITADIFDESDRIIDTDCYFINEDQFDKFETFTINFYDIPKKPSKIRLYPKNSWS